MGAKVVKPAAEVAREVRSQEAPEVLPHECTQVRPRECTTVHTRILRLALGVEESRLYWAEVDPSVPPAERAMRAFEERWFGAKSLERVRYLLASFLVRYDAYPAALEVLRRWKGMEPATRQVICHWHLQLADPLYRAFTGSYLLQRRGMAEPSVDRDATLRWVKAEHPGRWSESTCVQFASKLLSAAAEAGLVSAKREQRSLSYPRVTDEALAYLLQLLRETKFEGTSTDNPYLASVGLTDGFLDQRLRILPGLAYRRMAQLTEMSWSAPDLATWGEATR